MNRQRVRAVLVTLVLVALTIGLATLSTAAADDITRIDLNHELASDEAIADWQNTGYAVGATHQYDMTLEVAEDRATVADGARFADVTNDWLRIDYRETVSRTLRIQLPSEYATPFTREGIQSVTSDHTVDVEPAKEGDVLQLTVDVKSASDIVVPLSKEAQTSYQILDHIDSRVETIFGSTPLGSDATWQYVNVDTLAQEAAVPLANHSDVLVQVDARPESSSQLWINAVSGQNSDSDVYYYTKEGSDGENVTTYLVSTVADPPDVRFAEDADQFDRIQAEINGARTIPDHIAGLVDSIVSDIPVIG